MLDEKICPVPDCRKNLTHPNIDMSIWAVAHYLAHLVQQNRQASPDEMRQAIYEAALKTGSPSFVQCGQCGRRWASREAFEAGPCANGCEFVAAREPR